MNYAIFAGGCFWGVEHFFKTMTGVTAVISGYSGGHTENPTYEDVLTGTSGHIEVVQIEYDNSKVSYDDLLNMFFKIHDPTTMDRQGPDVGEQYKSVIFYNTEEEKQFAKNKIINLNNANIFLDSIVTEIRKAKKFYRAEEYHQDYIEKNGRICYHQMYVNQNQSIFNSDF